MRMAILLVLLLVGCVSPEQIEANKQAYCANLGAPKGSKDYYQCRRDLEIRDAAQYQAGANALQEMREREKLHDQQQLNILLNSRQQTGQTCRAVQNGNVTTTQCN